jgi:hypothetical protein
MESVVGGGRHHPLDCSVVATAAKDDDDNVSLLCHLSPLPPQDVIASCPGVTVAGALASFGLVTTSSPKATPETPRHTIPTWSRSILQVWEHRRLNVSTMMRLTILMAKTTASCPSRPSHGPTTITHLSFQTHWRTMTPTAMTMTQAPMTCPKEVIRGHTAKSRQTSHRRI